MAAQNGLEADTMFIKSPDLHGDLHGMSLALPLSVILSLSYGLSECFLKASCARGSPFWWRGRGVWLV
jgi:hypothetical protein